MLVFKVNSVLSDSRTRRAKPGELLYSRYGKRSVMPASRFVIALARRR